MPKEIKKRTHVASSVALFSRNPRAAESEDVRALRRILKETHTDTVIQSISDSLTTTTPENLRALKDILGTLFEAPQHCVRCHVSYTQSENNYTACEVMCDDEGEWHDAEDEELGFEDGYYVARCCHRTYGQWESPHNVCFTSRHTSNPQGIRYYKGLAGYNVGDEGLNFTSRKMVFTCYYNGCNLAST
ncbi:hypothetical protein BDV93DRAFT_526860 [Ceratobasidium sp. AG-I]|nr:hypothetical protein BDV93DRAFT_526860 [Ceratobasidium sp. AG-I]